MTHNKSLSSWLLYRTALAHKKKKESLISFSLSVQDALGGNSKCSLVANVSPAEKNAEETLSTLKFAQRAKLMRNDAVVNEDMFGNPAIVAEMLRKMKLELAYWKGERSLFLPSSSYCLT